MSSSFTGLEVETRDGVMDVRLNLNENNRLDQEAFARLRDVWENVGRNPDVRAMVLSSSVPGFFTNGLAPEMFLDRSESEVREAVEIMTASTGALFACPIPVVCLIQGHCMGAGTVFALLSDYRFMADKGARIGFPESAIAMNFPAFSAVVLKDLVGTRGARDLLYSGKLMKGPEALDVGLVDSVHAGDEVEARARKQATSLAALQPGASRGIKEGLRRDYLNRMDELVKKDRELLTATILTADAQEGFRSIVENRRPRFPG